TGGRRADPGEEARPGDGPAEPEDRAPGRPPGGPPAGTSSFVPGWLIEAMHGVLVLEEWREGRTGLPSRARPLFPGRDLASRPRITRFTTMSCLDLHINPSGA